MGLALPFHGYAFRLPLQDFVLSINFLLEKGLQYSWLQCNKKLNASLLIICYEVILF